MSLLFNFLEMLDTLIKDPSEYEMVETKIKRIIKNMHHLLNLYRPHQARQTLIAIMEEQIKRREDFLASLEKRVSSCEKILSKSKKDLYNVDLQPVELRIDNQNICH
eukprot:TRINITY_DN2638_c0_g1_i5.p1 TRINITY_DN2638_c0_g1~~TRINITY_DN2638_c0_g1_i5.p1  ORF type:complete len:107 (-),score=19.70 TRINITY_DN2638_c0_g1_i5:309-629(-)